MYIAFGRKVVDTEEMKNEIEKNSEFKVLKDMSKGTKREDTFAYNLSISIDILNEIAFAHPMWEVQNLLLQVQLLPV